MTEFVLSDHEPLTQQQFEKFKKLIYETTGISLSNLKHQLVASRLARRLRHHGFQRFEDYYEMLVQEDVKGAEFGLFVNSVTTNKTHFFREKHHFEFLRETLVRRANASMRAPRKLRIWCAASSTGEEPYTILITVLEAISDFANWDLRLLASDIDSDVLATACRGIYPEGALEEVPKSSVDRWFVRGEGDRLGDVRVRRELRQRATFKRINLVDPAWPIKAEFDAIFCRNLLIYFDADTQTKVVGRMLKYLKVGGHIFLGHAESMVGARTPGLRSLGKTIFEHVGT